MLPGARGAPGAEIAEWRRAGRRRYSQIAARSRRAAARPAAFFKSQLLFWLIGATDGHAKNFIVFLRPGGRFALTPFYDVLSAQGAFDRKQIPNNKYKLAMSVSTSRKYRILDIAGRHFIGTAQEAGLGVATMTSVLDDILERGSKAASLALSQSARGFSSGDPRQHRQGDRFPAAAARNRSRIALKVAQGVGDPRSAKRPDGSEPWPGSYRIRQASST
ncbi:HipA domain-containing protein [Sphingopyxis sp. LARHCG72]